MPEFFNPDPEYTDRPLPIEDSDGSTSPDPSFAAIVGAALLALRAPTDALGNGEISVTDWESEFGGGVSVYHTAAYLTGQQASDIVDPADVGTVTDAGMSQLAPAVATQRAYVQRFSDDLRSMPDGALPATARSRADMYGRSVGQSFWTGYTGDFQLPVYPRQRSTCASNCCCFWSTGFADYTTGNAEFHWVLSPCNHCPQCPVRAQVFAPYRFTNWVGDPVTDTSVFLGAAATPRTYTRKESPLVTIPQDTWQPFKTMADPLTDREVQVAQLIAEGLTNPEIAQRLVITSHTVKTHVEHVQGKLGCGNRVQTAVKVARMGGVR